MDIAGKRGAEAILKRLLEGSEIGGIGFGAIRQIFVNPANGPPEIHGLVYVNLASRWQLYGQRPTILPDWENDLPDFSREQELTLLCSLEGDAITGVTLGEEKPHLMMQLRSGRFFFMNGSKPQYEPWDAGVIFDWENAFHVFALPDDEISWVLHDRLQMIPGYDSE